MQARMQRRLCLCTALKKLTVVVVRAPSAVVVVVIVVCMLHAIVQL